MRQLMVSFLILSSFGSYAQESLTNTLNTFDTSTQDSTIISTLRELHYYVDPEKSSEAKAEIQEGAQIIFDNVAYSADSVIRVFRYSWEECGVYCIELDIVLLTYIDSTKNKLGFLGLGNRVGGKVYSIQKLEKGKYLILTRSMSREQGGGSASHLTAYLISITGTAEILWTFDIYAQDQDEDAILYLEYDAKTKMITYSYKFYEYLDHQKDCIKTGSWLFRNGNFNIQNEKTVYNNK